MLILLRQDLNRVGKAGEIVKVKDGYGRNYLIPQGMAYPATDSFMKVYNESTKSKKYQEMQIKKSAEYLKSLLDKKAVTISMKVGEDGKLFGSVTSQHIADELKNKGIDLDKKKINLEENIKQLGEYKIPYKSPSEEATIITLNVVDEAGDRKPIIDEEELANVPDEVVEEEIVEEEIEELEEDEKAE
ncbi:MAG: 50S ribosomal protein L9 [Candidatus Delongbacteria bacterium]|jgi:large subunit ribosomal protein L9|nr:50S ribosomal protein L9 [Candidatus Delongbacteria bacterium]